MITHQNYPLTKYTFLCKPVSWAVPLRVVFLAELTSLSTGLVNSPPSLRALSSDLGKQTFSLHTPTVVSIYIYICIHTTSTHDFSLIFSLHLSFSSALPLHYSVPRSPFYPSSLRVPALLFGSLLRLQTTGQLLSVNVYVWEEKKGRI